MFRSFSFVLISLAFVWCRAAWSGAEPDPKAARFQRIITVVLENTDYSSARQQPFLASLMRRGATLTNFHAVAHPSQPNYIALIAGSTKGVQSDRNVDLGGRHVGNLLEEAGLGWKVYAEDYPGGCFLRKTSGLYARKHVPFLSFLNVQQSSGRCARVQGAGAFAADAESGELPEYSLYVPNLENDGHDTDVGFADRWLSRTFGEMLDDPVRMAGTLFVVTFDESEDPLDRANQVLTVLVGPMVKPGVENSERMDHYSLLRLLEDNFQLGTLEENDESAARISGIWQ